MRTKAGIKIKKVLISGLASVFLSSNIVAAVEEKVTVTAAGSEAVLKETNVEIDRLEEEQYQEALPVAESGNDGYWWIKQDEATKLSYVDYLIKAFNLEDEQLKPKEIIEKLDVFYNPVDNPLDIKMDISLERGFDRVIKRKDR
jgi:hypothetical protein